MKTIIATALCFLLVCPSQLRAQDQTYKISVTVSVSKKVSDHFKPTGRMFIFLVASPQGEPYTMTWPNPGNNIFARNFRGLKSSAPIDVTNSDGWNKTPVWSLDSVPYGEYFIQVVWDQDTAWAGIDDPGNLFSTKQKIVLNRSQEISTVLEHVISPPELVESDLVKLVNMKSDTLSKWWGKPVSIKASILLPAHYDRKKKTAYPIRYNVAGYGGRYNRVSRLVSNPEFMKWWLSDDAPRIINVFLDGDGPLGDSYQMDSENSGPYGYSLIHELIPYIEKEYRGTDSPETRFVDGCSTGGWVSLALQLFYPETFNGVFSYSPDAVDFKHYQLIDIYSDQNAFINEYGYLRPVMRTTEGEPVMSLEDFIQYENVLGYSNTYLNSGGQFSAHTALYSPKGSNGLPAPLFDPHTGEIDPVIAEAWKKYDLRLYTQKNWTTLGPEIQGKVYIWMGDMDHFYLNLATRDYSEYLKTNTNPVSDARIEFSPMEGHCQEYTHKKVLEQIARRIENLK